MTEIIRLALAALFFMLRSLAKLKLQTNFDAIFKTVKILKIDPVDPNFLYKKFIKFYKKNPTNRKIVQKNMIFKFI